MKKKFLALAMLGSALFAAGCDNNHGGGSGTNGGATTLSSLMTQLFNGPSAGTPNTGELSLPIDINTLSLDNASEDPTQFAALLM